MSTISSSEAKEIIHNNNVLVRMLINENDSKRLNKNNTYPHANNSTYSFSKREDNFYLDKFFCPLVHPSSPQPYNKEEENLIKWKLFHLAVILNLHDAKKHGEIDNITYTIIYSFLSMSKELIPETKGQSYNKSPKHESTKMFNYIKDLLCIVGNNVNKVAELLIILCEKIALQPYDLAGWSAYKNAINTRKLRTFIDGIDNEYIENMYELNSEMIYNLVLENFMERSCFGKYYGSIGQSYPLYNLFLSLKEELS